MNVLIPIFSDAFLHPLHKDNDLSLLYVRHYGDTEGRMICINHPDCGDRESIDEILSTMKVDFGPGQFITTNRFKFLVNDAFARFDHVVKAKVYEEFPETKFIYTGPNDGSTRDVCKHILQKFRKPLTKKEIDELKIPIQKDKSQFRGFVDRGGYNCRHDWIKVS